MSVNTKKKTNRNGAGLTTALTKKSLIVGGIVAVILIYFFAAINHVPNYDQEVKKRWSELLASYTVRQAIVDDLAGRIKSEGYDDMEMVQGVLRDLRRAQVIQADEYLIDDEEAFALYLHRQGLVDIQPIVQTIHATPSMKADDELSEYVAKLESVNNKISKQQQYYDEAVIGYNDALVKFPSGFWAQWLYPSYQQRPTIQSLLVPSDFE